MSFSPPQHRLLVVDDPSSRACNLREALLRTGIKVHVASSATAALTFIRQVPIHTAFVAHDMGDETSQICMELDARKIPYIMTASPAVSPNSATRRALELVSSHI